MELSITLLNFGYAIVGAILTLLFMMLGYKIFDKMTPFETSKQLAEKNVAVGIVNQRNLTSSPPRCIENFWL